MPRIRAPQSTTLQPIQYRQPKDFSEAILATGSQNPLALGIDTLGQLGSQAITAAATSKKKRKELAEAIALLQTSQPITDEQTQNLSPEDAPALRQLALSRITERPEARQKTQLELQKLERDVNAPYPSPANIIVPGFTDPLGQPVSIPSRGIPTPTSIPGLKKTVQQPRTANEMSLRKEFSAQPVVKDFASTARSVQRIVDAAKDPSGAGDLALIFNYMKTLDPGSTVREGEFATAQNSASVPDVIRARYNKVISGERLSPDQRADFVDRAMRLYEGQEQANKQIEDQYRGYASELGLDPEQAIVDFKIKGLRRPLLKPLPSPSSANNPAVGQTFNGGTITAVREK